MRYQFACRNGRIGSHLAKLIEESVQGIDPDVHFVTDEGQGSPRCWLDAPEHYADEAFKDLRDRLANRVAKFIALNQQQLHYGAGPNPHPH